MNLLLAVAWFLSLFVGFLLIWSRPLLGGLVVVCCLGVLFYGASRAEDKLREACAVAGGEWVQRDRGGSLCLKPGTVIR
jgi:hypothetical protein